MSFALPAFMDRLLPSSPVLLYGGLAALALLMLVLFSVGRMRRRRARRAELRVWHPGRTGDVQGQAAAVDEILEPPAWLANATIRRRVTPTAPLGSADPAAPTASAQPGAATGSVATAAAAPAKPAASMDDSAARAEAPSVNATRVAVREPSEEEQSTALKVDATDVTPPAVVPMQPPPSAPETPHTSRPQPAGFTTRLAPVRGASLMSSPTPHVTVHVDASEVASPASRAYARAEANAASAEPTVIGAVADDVEMRAPLPDDAAQEPATADMPVGDRPALSIDQACAQARRLAAQGRQGDALAVLRPVLDDNAPATAWAMAGWCAWNLAEVSAAPLALAQEAASAFGRALAMDPTREGALARMVGRCHLLQADADVPARRSTHLAAAVAAYERGFDQGMSSESALLEWAQALYESAIDHLAARTELLSRLDNVLARGPATAHASSAWSRHRARAAWLHAQAATNAAERRRHHQEGAEQAKRAHATLEDAISRDAWLAEWIEAERRHLALLSPAARSDGYRSLSQRTHSPLKAAQGTAPWLAWVHVLADTSQWLQGPAARQRLGEADTILARLETRHGDVPGEQQAVTFARAYYLRLRAAHEPAGSRREVLAQAARLLARLRDHPDFPAQPGVIMEQAEIALARANEGHDAQAHFEEAAEHAGTAADQPQTRVAAFRVLLAALLGWQQRQATAARMQQIGVVAQWLVQADTPPAAETLRLLAAAALARQDMAEAARLSAAAWEAGAEGHVLLPGWRHADAAWARQLVETSERSAWEHQHRLLRLAASSH